MEGGAGGGRGGRRPRGAADANTAAAAAAGGGGGRGRSGVEAAAPALLVGAARGVLGGPAMMIKNFNTSAKDFKKDFLISISNGVNVICFLIVET